MINYISMDALFLLVIFYTSCQGQNQTDLPTDTIKPETEDVITFSGPQRVTRTIKQDRKGNIWIAAHDGIFRYDGKSFTNITSKVSSARFFSVLEDRKGNFWFSSPDAGVYYYDGKSFQHFTTKEGLARDVVTNIYEDKTGTIWFGTVGGASRYDGKSFRTYTPKPVTNLLNWESKADDWNNDVHSIIEDKTGKFWFGTRGDTYVYDGKTFTVLTYQGKPFKNVLSIIEDKKGHIWLGSNDGLWRYDGRAFTNFSQNACGYIYEDKKGNIWTSSPSANGQYWAITRFEEKSLFKEKTTVIETDSQIPIFGIVEANDGSIWFGSNGLYRYDGNTITNFKGKQVQK